MYTATFIFAKKQYDEDFHLLDGRIAEAARALPGYLGEESWEDPARGLISNVYYWESLDALQALIRHPLPAGQGRPVPLAGRLPRRHRAGDPAIRRRPPALPAHP